MPTKKQTTKSKTEPRLFGFQPNRQLLFDCVQAYLTNRRQGTHRAKTRGEVSGSTAKLYRQKGTGRARHGDAKANIFVGGGIAFPPLPKQWRCALPKQIRRRGLAHALSLRHQEGRLQVVPPFHFEKIQTKQAAAQLKKWKVESGLVVIDKPDETLWRSFRNLAGVRLVTAQELNVVDLLSFPQVVLTEPAVQLLEARLV